MAGFLDYHKVRLFDFPRWAEPLREELRENAEQIAEAAGLQIEFIRKLKAFRKEARIKAILAERGDHPGLVHIFSAMGSCLAYRPWHEKSPHRTFLKSTSGKCLHYYFYLINEQFGLCNVRVPRVMRRTARKSCRVRVGALRNGSGAIAICGAGSSSKD